MKARWHRLIIVLIFLVVFGAGFGIGWMSKNNVHKFMISTSNNSGYFTITNDSLIAPNLGLLAPTLTRHYYLSQFIGKGSKLAPFIPAIINGFTGNWEIVDDLRPDYNMAIVWADSAQILTNTEAICIDNLMPPNYTWGLQLIAPTDNTSYSSNNRTISFADGVSNNISITIKAVK